MITARHLSKYYDRVKAVDDISFEVKEGENMVLLGTSGCGKTTTLKMINRLVESTHGYIAVNGTDVKQHSPEALRRGIGYVLQHNSLFPHYTVEENIAVVPHLLKWDKNKIKVRTAALLDQLRLPQSCVTRYPAELSGGQQQRVNIARALAADPPVLLMDEPFGALDVITRTKISREVSEIDEFMRKTIVMVTHDVQEAFLIGDRICLMSNGRIIQSGTPAELLFNPASDFVKEFFSASYLRLALETIKVADVWNSLQGEAMSGNKMFTTRQSLWYILEETIKEGYAGTISVMNEQGAVKCVSKEELFKAVSSYKSN